MQTVKQVIAMLRKLDQKAIVAFAAHDNCDGEIQGHVNYANEIDMDECGSKMDLKGNYVILNE